MFRRRLIGGVCAALLLTLSTGAHADVVTDWNEVLLGAIRVDRTAPPRGGRIMAIVHVSVFDAVNGIVGGYTPYHVKDAAPAGASAEAAAVEAAYTALVALFPAQKTTLDAARTASLAAIPAGTAKDAGIAWGHQVATDILTLRSDDGATTVVPYEVPEGSGWWLPTLPAFAPALLPNWPKVTPWCATEGGQFRDIAPPSPNSAEYTAAFREVKRFGSATSTFRTADQTQIAFFWEDGPGSYTPPGHWNAIAQVVSAAEGLSLIENARLFALINITAADAAIVSWDHKFAYHHWRPITGIRNADHDGNPDTVADPAWTPLIPTPPFPAYTSGHSTFSGSASRLLALFFGTDDVHFVDRADPGRWPEQLTGVQREFDSFSEASEEAGQSRIYGGIHWQYDNQLGLSSGRALAEHVFFNFLRPVGQVSTCTSGATTACLHGGRFKVEAAWETSTTSGPARAADLTGDSTRFWFFDEDNTELVVKVLDGCGTNDKFWVFASGLTDVEVTVTVTDTQTGKVRTYFNPQATAFKPVLDVDAFATCP